MLIFNPLEDTMTETHIPHQLEEQILSLAHTLYEAIEGGDRDQILTAQQALSQTVGQAWERFDHSDASDKDKAVARLLSDMAVQALPAEIQDPANYPEILRKLRLLKNSLILLK